MKYKNIYVAASSQHVGKTTSTLGLVSGFINRGLNVGYCKPVGQKYLNINNIIADKDTVLFASLIHFNIKPEIHSPVILGSGATTDYLKEPSKYTYKEDILAAKEKLNEMYEMTIYEGTGHPGVGSVADINNATVAKLLDAAAIIVIEGGIGSTIDMLNMSMALFREEGVPILGVIINKVLPEKLDKVKKYVSKWTEPRNIPILGVLPYDPMLGYPLIKKVNKAVDGTMIYNEDRNTNKVENILAGSLIDLNDLKRSTEQLLVVSTKSINQVIEKIDKIVTRNRLGKSPLSGIVATGLGVVEEQTKNYIMKHKIPLMRTHLDTYGCVVKISQIEVKINTNTPWKVQRAIELICGSVDFDLIKERTAL